jgi:hypothetical protein
MKERRQLPLYDSLMPSRYPDTTLSIAVKALLAPNQLEADQRKIVLAGLTYLFEDL